MKTKIVKIGMIAVLALLIVAMVNGCQKEEMNMSGNRAGTSSSSITDNRTTADGSAAVQLSATPVDFYRAVYLEITGVALQYENDKFGNGGWINLPVIPKVYNILQFQQDLALTLAAFNRLPYGRIINVKITLGKQCSVTWLDKEGLRHWARLLLGGLNHVIINPLKEAYVQKGARLVIWLSFDTRASISAEGEEIFILTPVVRVRSVDYE